MDSFKNGRWIVPFKEFGMVRVKKIPSTHNGLFQIQQKEEQVYLRPKILLPYMPYLIPRTRHSEHVPILTLTMINSINGKIHLPFLALSSIILRDIKMKT